MNRIKEILRNLKDKEFFKYKKLLTILALSVFGFLFFVTLNQYETNGNLKVVFMDIGQGNSTLIFSPNNQKILIDTGPNYITSQKVEKFMPFLSKTLDSVILTHGDLDHVGGTGDVVDNFYIKTLLISARGKYSDYIKVNEMNTIKVSSENALVLDEDLKLETLNPFDTSFSEENQNSIVNKMDFGNFEFIFMGDADKEIERSLVSQGYFDNSLKKILLVGHHGSDTSSSELFLKKLKPEYCIISVGKDNKYKHPNPTTLDILNKYCKNIYRTDLDGDIIFETDGKDLIVENKK